MEIEGLYFDRPQFVSVWIFVSCIWVFLGFYICAFFFVFVFVSVTLASVCTDGCPYVCFVFCDEYAKEPVFQGAPHMDPLLDMLPSLWDASASEQMLRTKILEACTKITGVGYLGFLPASGKKCHNHGYL